LPLFQLATRLNSQNPYETEIHNEHSYINLYMITANSKWHILSIDHTKMGFWLYFRSIHDYWH